MSLLLSLLFAFSAFGDAMGPVVYEFEAVALGETKLLDYDWSSDSLTTEKTVPNGTKLNVIGAMDLGGTVYTQVRYGGSTYFVATASISPIDATVGKEKAVPYGAEITLYALKKADILSGPSAGFRAVGSVPEGKTVTVTSGLDADFGLSPYSYVNYGGVSGWVFSSPETYNDIPPSFAHSPASDALSKVFVIGDGVKLRKGPDISSESIKTVPKGTELTYIYKYSFHDGDDYLSSYYVGYEGKKGWLIGDWEALSSSVDEAAVFRRGLTSGLTAPFGSPQSCVVEPYKLYRVTYDVSIQTDAGLKTFFGVETPDGLRWFDADTSGITAADRAQSLRLGNDAEFTAANGGVKKLAAGTEVAQFYGSVGEEAENEICFSGSQILLLDREAAEDLSMEFLDAEHKGFDGISKLLAPSLVLDFLRTERPEEAEGTTAEESAEETSEEALTEKNEAAPATEEAASSETGPAVKGAGLRTGTIVTAAAVCVIAAAAAFGVTALKRKKKHSDGGQG